MEDNIKTELREIVFEGMDKMQLAHVNAIMGIGFEVLRALLTLLATSSFLAWPTARAHKRDWQLQRNRSFRETTGFQISRRTLNIGMLIYSN
jgi:hypothetical protein